MIQSADSASLKGNTMSAVREAPRCAETHALENILGRETVLLNPGTVRYRPVSARATYALSDLATREFSIHNVVRPISSGGPPIKKAPHRAGLKLTY